MISRELLDKIAAECAALTAEKNKSYGDSFAKSGEILKILMPNGCPPEKSQDMLTVARIIDKLFRICTNKTAYNEDPWKDILGYALLMVASEGAYLDSDTKWKYPTQADIDAGDCMACPHTVGWHGPDGCTNRGCGCKLMRPIVK